MARGRSAREHAGHPLCTRLDLRTTDRRGLALTLSHCRPEAQSLVLLSLTLSCDGWAIPSYRFLLDWAYFTPLRKRWRCREQAPFGMRYEALRAKIARAMQRSNFSEVGPSTISLPTLRDASRLAARVRKQVHDIKTVV